MSKKKKKITQGFIYFFISIKIKLDTRPTKVSHTGQTNVASVGPAGTDTRLERVNAKLSKLAINRGFLAFGGVAS